MSVIDRSGTHLDNTNLHMELLDLAGRSLEMRMVADNATFSFVKMAGIMMTNTPTVSGLNDFDYQNFSGLPGGSHSISLLKTIGKVPLPPEVMEHFGHLECQYTLGLFPEIHRAWLTIDSDIYMWTYENETDVAYFDGLGEAIVSVGLIKPKSGVFQDFVKYLLILTTTVEIVALGVTFSNSPNNGMMGSLGEMHLVPEPVFVLPTDGVSMNVLQSTHTGRIFMGGKDGCLYEITYQAQMGWFGKHCNKVNHSTTTLSFLVPSFLNVALYEDDPIVKIEIDNSRHILYTLSEKGSIEVFDLGPNGDTLKRIVKLSQSKIVHMATEIVKTLEGANFRPITAISPIEENESPNLSLVAITQTGVRLYFSTGLQSTEGIHSSQVSQRPWCLSLVHVRLPPGFAANAPTLRPKDVQVATYNNGTALMISSGSQDSELLWCLCGSVGAGGMPRERAALLPLDGQCWALKRAAPSPNTFSSELQHFCEPSVASQHMCGPIRWVALTGSAAHIVQQLQPVDLLRQLLIDAQGADSPQVKAFFQMQKEEQACATCLVLACGSGKSAQDHISEWATRAYFLYGGQPSLHNQNTTQYPASPLFSPRQISTPMVGRSAANVHQSLQAALQPSSPTSPISHPQQSQHMQDPNSAAALQFSAKHEGLYIYVGRILRPIWQKKCVTKSSVENQDWLSSNITSGDCAIILKYLNGVRLFLERNAVGASAPVRSFIHSANDSTLNITRQDDIFAREKHSLDALRSFINISCEMLSLWKILTEHQFHIIASALPQEQQSALSNASFRELLLAGQEVASILILSLINQYLTDNASVDSISSELREVCPSLYKSEDAACSKANEILLFANQQVNPHEKQEMLNNALKLCKDVAPHVNLPIVCSKFSQAGFYRGVVDLCVTCADKIDPNKIALHFYKNNRPNHDQEGYLAFYKRMDLYGQITTVLEQLFEQSGSGVTGEGLGSASPQSTHRKSNTFQDIPSMSPSDANYQARKLVSDCLSYPDEILHVTVYEWMLSKQLYGELIALSEPSLETFLVQTSKNNPDATHVFDLLWKYYEKCGNHAAAARILENLATKPNPPVSLNQRCNWLSQAVVCLRGGAGSGGLLRELEDRAEVARLQRRIHQQASHKMPAHAAQTLNSSLLDITKLYEDYADKYELWEFKLAIVHCSGHNDPLLVENIWTNIIQDEIKNMKSVLSNQDKMAGLLSKVNTLGKEYVSSGHCFPVAFILKQLELQCCRLDGEPGQAARMLLDIDVHMEQLIDIYTRLISLNERIWLSEGNELHLIQSATVLMDNFISKSSVLSPHHRRRVLIKCQDLVSISLNALYTKPDTEDLVRTLKGIQTRLERME